MKDHGRLLSVEAEDMWLELSPVLFNAPAGGADTESVPLSELLDVGSALSAPLPESEDEDEGGGNSVLDVQAHSGATPASGGDGLGDGSEGDGGGSCLG